MDPKYKITSKFLLCSERDPKLICYTTTVITFSMIILGIIALLVSIETLTIGAGVMAWIVIEMIYFIWSITLFLTMMRKLVLFNDKYYFQPTMKAWNQLGIPSIMIMLVCVIVNQNIRFIGIVSTIMFIVTCAQCVVCLVYYPIYMMKSDNAKVLNELSNSDNLNYSSNHISRRKLMVNILSNETGFELFMSHLVKEFASENLLFIVYLIQFQRYLIETNYLNFKVKMENDKSLILIDKEWILPNNVPKASIFNATSIWDEEKIDSDSNKRLEASAINIAEIIYQKFIQRDFATMEVNISDRNRTDLTQTYQNWKNCSEKETLDIEILWKPLRVAGLETWTLMMSSLNRFDSKQWQV